MVSCRVVPLTCPLRACQRPDTDLTGDSCTVTSVNQAKESPRSGGTVVVVVWAEIHRNPGYLALAEVIDELAGEQAATFRSPYGFGEPEALRSTLESAGVREVDVATVSGTARFDSVAALLRGEIDGSPLAEQVSSDDAELLERATTALAPFIGDEGRVEFHNPAVIAKGRG